MKPVRSLVPLILVLWLFSCRKESFTNSPDALLHYSADTLHFDTLFTSTGSTSQLVKILNNNKKGIRVSSVRLSGGNSSPFRINTDGISGIEADNLELPAGDSLYIFATVHIDPNASSLPFILRDSIAVTYNGHTDYIQLDAWGRNAHFFRNRTITGSETWNNDLPYVILGGLKVDSNAVLTINKGCQVFIHADAPLIVNGSLQVLGEKEDSSRVQFSGDRLDAPYRDFPASYPGILFTSSSSNNLLRYALIRNAYQGIVAVDPVAGTKLVLEETIIDNAYDAGLTGINTSISARNLVVSNCGKNILLYQGGNYDFIHCTVVSSNATYIQHRYPVLTVTDYTTSPLVIHPLNALFKNSIFWGENNGLVPDEVVVLKQGAPVSSVAFDHVLWRVQTRPAFSSFTDTLSQDPLLDSLTIGNNIYPVRLKTGSPALERGLASPVNLDILGRSRPVGLPDLGAFEKQ